MGLLQVIYTLVLFHFIASSGTRPVSERLRNIMHQRQRRQVARTRVPSSATRSRVVQHSSGHTTSSDISLLYKNGWFLAIYDDGNINGTSDARSPDIKLQLRSVGTSLVQIFSKTAHVYVAMSSTGRVYTTESPKDETIFKQTHEPSGFQTFASHKHQVQINKKHKLLFLSMRKTGHMKNGWKTTRNHKTTLLSILPERETS